jgi:hypothetical protein
MSPWKFPPPPLVALEFELRASGLLGKHLTTWATPSAWVSGNLKLQYFSCVMVNIKSFLMNERSMAIGYAQAFFFFVELEF